MKTYLNEEKKNTLDTPEARLEQFVSNDTKIFIDTSSILEDCFFPFIDHVKPLLEKYNNRIIVPTSVIRKLISHMDDPDPKRADLRQRAIEALRLLDQHKNTVFRIMGEEGDKEYKLADNLFVSLCIRFRRKYHMLFITQDRGLAADILNNNKCHSMLVKAAVVKKITTKGYLSNLNVMYKNEKWIAPEFL